jgi:tripartite-type tricarboxylate transporter receptor subunit TctC
VRLIHIPYKGSSPALNDLLGGRVSMGFMTSLGSMPYFKDGRLRPLAVASATRLSQLPDVPTMAEAGFPSVEIDSWSGLLAPAKTPSAIVEKLQREVAKALASPDVNTQLVSQGAVVVGSTPAAFRAFLAKEHNNYGVLIKGINLELN